MKFKKPVCLSWCLGHGDWLNIILACDGITVDAERVVYGEIIAETRVMLTRETVAKLDDVSKGMRVVYSRSACGMVAKALDYMRDAKQRCDVCGTELVENYFADKCCGSCHDSLVLAEAVQIQYPVACNIDTRHQ